MHAVRGATFSNSRGKRVFTALLLLGLEGQFNERCPFGPRCGVRWGVGKMTGNFVGRNEGCRDGLEASGAASPALGRTYGLELRAA